MDQQNQQGAPQPSNNQGNNSHQNSNRPQGGNQGQGQRQSQGNRDRYQDRPKNQQGQGRPPYDKNNNANNNHDRNRGVNNQNPNFKPREPRNNEKAAAPVDAAVKERNEQKSAPAHNNNRPPRPQNTNANPPRQHQEAHRPIKAARVETVEDIQADIERVEKDIQFEIKQIKSIKLGL